MDEFLNDELNEKEQKVIDLYRDESIVKKLHILEFLSADIVNPSWRSFLGKSK